MLRDPEPQRSLRKDAVIGRLGGKPQNLGPDLFQRELMLDGAHLPRDPRHSIDNRCRLVLTDRDGPGLAQVQKPAAPSRPIPVRSTAMTREGKPTADWKSASTDGVWPEMGGPSVIVHLNPPLLRSRRCPGAWPATQIMPSVNVIPSSAATTLAPQRRSNNRIRLSENPLPVCWTIAVGGQSAGNPASTVNSASTPPVEAPISTTFSALGACLGPADILAINGERRRWMDIAIVISRRRPAPSMPALIIGSGRNKPSSYRMVFPTSWRAPIGIQRAPSA